MTSHTPGMQPGMVLVLSEPVSEGPGARFTAALRRRLGSAPGVRILDGAALAEMGLASALSGALERLAFERALAGEIAACLRAADATPLSWARFPIIVVAPLAELSGSRFSIALLPLLEGAIRRVSFPRGVHPTLVGIHVLPERWDGIQGARLFAWLREFAGALRLVDDGQAAFPGYALRVVLGSSDLTAEGTGERMARPPAELAEAAASFAASCLEFRVIDAVLERYRGRPRGATFEAVGLGSTGTAMGDARVLWPVDAGPLRGGGSVLKAVLGGVEVPDGWVPVPAYDENSPAGGRRLQIATRLRVSDLMGAEEWRSRYLALLPAEQRELHGIPGAPAWPDPLAPAPAGPTESPVEVIL